jgi:hypothetical protein
MPLPLEGADVELLWPAAADDDEACRFLRETIARLATASR